MIIKALKQGFQLTWRYKRIILLLFILTFLLAAVVALPLKNLLESTVGHSLMIGDIVKGFNYTFLNDFMNAHGDGFTPIFQQSILVLFLYVILFVFLMGGILSTFQQQPDAYDKGLFWSKSAHYFWRIFRMTIYFLLIQGAVLVFFSWLFLFFAKGLSPNLLESDTTIFRTLQIILPIYILVAILVSMWHDYAKIHLIKSDDFWLYPSILGAFKLIFKNPGSTIGLYFLNMLILGLLILVNYLLSSAFTIQSTATIFLSFLLSQVFVIGRLGLRLVNLGSVGVMEGES